MGSSFFSEKKQVIIVACILSVIIVASSLITMIFLINASNQDISFSFRNMTVQARKLDLTLEIRNPSFLAKSVDFNLASQNTNPILFRNITTAIAGGSVKNITISFNLPSIILFPDQVSFRLDKKVQDQPIRQTTFEATYDIPEFDTDIWKITDTFFTTKKGKPWQMNLWLDLSTEDFSSAQFSPIYQIQPVSDFSTYFGWPEVLIGSNPLQETLTIPTYGHSMNQAFIQLEIGPFLQILDQPSYYAFNIDKDTLTATYHLDSVRLTLSKGTSYLSNQSIVMDKPLLVQQDENEHAILTAALVDEAFNTNFGNLTSFLSGLEERSLEYNNVTYQVKEFLNITFSPLPLDWIPVSPFVGVIFNNFSNLLKDRLNLTAKWNIFYKGSYSRHHGFDLGVGLSGLQSQGMEAGLSYLPGNLFVLFGGWYENELFEREFDLETMQAAFLHEFCHTLGIDHVPETNYLMSPFLGDWRLHEQTYQDFIDNIDQYNGL